MDNVICETTFGFTEIFALLGWILAIIQLLLNYFEKKRISNNDLLLQAVDYFDGGTQKRSIGISLFEGLIKEKKNYSNVLIPLLTNQIVYLLLQGTTENRIHEERNVIRIFNLLEELLKNDKSRRNRFYNIEIINAIDRRLEGTKSTVNIPDETLKLRKNKFEEILNTS